MRIWKYELDITDTQWITIPVGAKILTAQFQNDELCLWAIVDETTPQFEERVIRIIGTGNPIPEVFHALKYIATAQQFGGQLVWHIFEE